ncbi:MAG: hypothetical protein P8J33_03715 [Pirellulaceae bacterium]|nr:hypothetical protein [Pirellulaceae bacterium]
MLDHKQWVIAIVLVTCTTLATIAEAQLKMPFKRRASTAATSQSLELTQTAGPWLIMCASFNGEQGLQQAIQLSNELRNDHGMNAYVYRHQFNHSEKVQGSGWAIPAEEVGLPKRTNWKAKSGEYNEQVAVVVGDFATVEDYNAKKVLGKLKTIQPRSMMNSEYAETHQSLEQQHRAGERGPLAAAFLMPNPILPPDYFKARNIDKVVEKMNKGVKYGLLKCPGQYSVRVATFGGEQEWNVTVQRIDEARRETDVNRGKVDEDSKLVDAAYKANVLCRALRKKGVEAYEFHDRNESYVCVGGYEWATRKNDSGKDVLNPEVAEVIQQYKGVSESFGHGTAMRPRTMSAFKDYDIKFDVQPMPVLVPKLNPRTSRLGGILRR